MATSTSIHNFVNPSLPIITRPNLNDTTHKTPKRFHQNPIKSLKEICKQGNLKQSFESLTNILTLHNNTHHYCVDEAYSLLLDLCAARKTLSLGQQIHTHVVKSNYVYDQVFLITKLVHFYAKCGCVCDAHKVFDGMSDTSVFTWNAMIGGYVNNGEPYEAVELFCEMCGCGVSPDAYTFSCVLKACGELKDIDYGTRIHGLVIKLGFVSNVFVVNSLMAVYTKCSDLNAVMLLFDDKTEDAVSWNSVISAYNANGEYMEALSVFREMLMAAVSPTSYTFVAALQAFEDPSYFRLGTEIHAAILKSSHCRDIHVANALIVMYMRCGRIGEAARIFNGLDEKDNISWNSMLSGLVQNGLYSEALNLFRGMLGDANREPDRCSVLSMITASGRLGILLNGMELHAYAMKNGMDSDFQVANTLIDMYAKCCNINYLNGVFDRMPFKDSISWTTAIAGCAQNGSHLRSINLFREALIKGIDVDGMVIGSILLACNALKCISLVKELHAYILRRKLFDLVVENTLLDIYGECRYIDYAYHVFKLIEAKDVVSYTSMISSYSQNGLANEALAVYVDMIKIGIKPDSVALVSALSATSDLASLRKGKELHGFLMRNGFLLEGSVAGSLLDMYASCGDLGNSRKVFSSIIDKDLVLWTSMINAYGMHGDGEKAITLFRKMEDEKLIPDHISFLAILYACSHSALVDQGRKYFNKMKYEYKLEPWMEHYVCLVDMLGRANHLDEAFQFVENMQIEPNASIWCALLGACRVHSNKELGEFAAKKLLELDPWNAGNYVLVSNFYATLGKWEKVEETRMRMKEKGIKKDPACSWIEVENKVHTFVARDKSHPDSDKLYEKLRHITEVLKNEGGYEAQTKFVLHNVDEEDKVKMIHGHSERLAIAYGLLTSRGGTPIRITKNLRVCDDCHTFSKLVSKKFEREIIVRDGSRFHHFVDGVCSCRDFW